MMKNRMQIKEREQVSWKSVLRIGLPIFFTLVSLGIGFVIAFGGQGTSFLETSLISALITLFGFSLTATVFVHQAFKDNETEKTKYLIGVISKTLILTVALICASLLFDFVSSLETSQIVTLIFRSLEYAALIYALICQIDILRSFIIIVTRSNK